MNNKNEQFQGAYHYKTEDNLCVKQLACVTPIRLQTKLRPVDFGFLIKTKPVVYSIRWATKIPLPPKSSMKGKIPL